LPIVAAAYIALGLAFVAEIDLDVLWAAQPAYQAETGT
jgi:hypothetical protein